INRDDAVGFSIGAYGYAGTGMDAGFSLKKDFWKYDPGSDLWTQVADFGGTPRQYCSSFTINNTGYVFGGIDNSVMYQNDLWAYNPTSNSWTAMASMPAVGRSASIAFAINGKGYAGTGNTGTTYLNDFWE